MTQSVELAVNMTRISLVVALLFCSSAFAQTARARSLNSQGFDFYKQQKYAEAIAKFREATQADPKYAMGWYNLAATLGLMRTHKRVCEFDAYRKNVTDALSKAIALDKKRKSRMVTDTDLDSIRDTTAYQRLLGVNPTTKDGFAKLIENVTWWGPASGAYGNNSGIDFGPKGAVTYWELEMTPEMDAPKKRTFTGKWRALSAGQLELQLEGRGTLNARLNGDQLFVRTKPGEESEVPMTDQPSECEA